MLVGLLPVNSSWDSLQARRFIHSFAPVPHELRGFQISVVGLWMLGIESVQNLVVI
jgi:hypothetical protein